MLRKNIVAIIPARGNSKRIPGKNYKKFKKKALKQQQFAKKFTRDKMTEKLGEILEKSSDFLMKNMNRNTFIMDMLNSGSKGKPANLSQIIITLGQQSIQGKRVLPKFYNSINKIDKLFLNTDLDIFVIPPSPYLQFFL